MRRLLLTIVPAASLPVAVCAQAAASSNEVLAQQIVLEIAQTKGAATPPEWLKAHPDERLKLAPRRPGRMPGD